MKNGLDEQYVDLLKDILENGVEKNTRNGKVLSVFGRQIRHSMSEGFPILTTKRIHFKSVVSELLWFLGGRTDLKWLLEHDNTIWVGDAYQAYLKKSKDKVESNSIPYQDLHLYGTLSGPISNATPRQYTKEEFINKIKTDDEFAKTWGSLGSIYGKQWRSWGNSIIDDLGEVYSKEVEYDTQNSRTPNGSSMRKFVIDEIKKYKPNIDQIANLINDLKTNPDSRRLMVSAWNVGELDQMVLPPCHYGFQVYTRELSNEERNKCNWDVPKEVYQGMSDEQLDRFGVPTRAISLMWNQRSVDTFLGLPFNIASYGLLLEIIARIVNMVPDELIGNLGDTHLYLNHIEQAKEQIGRKYTPEERQSMLKKVMGEEFYKTTLSELMPFGGGLSEYYDSYKIPYHTRESYPLPTLKLLKTDSFWNGFDVSLFTHLDPTDFIIENYKSHPTIKAPLSN